MHPAVRNLPTPDPDFTTFLRVLSREPTDRVPLIELAIHPQMVAALLGEPLPAAGTVDGAAALVRQNVRLHHRLGFDAVKVSAPIPWGITRLQATDPEPPSGRLAWADEHAGPIATQADLDVFHWPDLAEVDFAPVHTAIDALPAGMKLLGFCGGVLEFAMDLMGMQNFLVATRKQPELVRAVVDGVGELLEQVLGAYCQFDAIGALWLGDDLGHKHGPLLAPRWVREHLVPWYRRFADVAHRHNRPFLLHTCGHTAGLMPDLVGAGIDAKHSFEDVIEPVEQFYDHWHARIAVLGGIDVHLLSVGTPEEVRARVEAVLAQTVAGGYMCGSGNSIPNYVPPENFLALVTTLHAHNA